MIARKKTRKQKAAPIPKVEVADMATIYREFLDAHLLVRVACRGIEDRDDDDSLMLLRQGVDALGKVSGKLEMAEMEFERRLRSTKKKERGAS
jgi:hypothetical protein